MRLRAHLETAERGIGVSNTKSMRDHDGETTDVETLPERSSSQASRLNLRSDIPTGLPSSQEKPIDLNETQDSRVSVVWDGENDPGDPRNWSTLYKS